MTLEEELHYLDLQSPSPDNIYRRVLDYLDKTSNESAYNRGYMDGETWGRKVGYKEGYEVGCHDGNQL